MKEGQPKAIELRDYQVPPYLIETTELHVDLDEDITSVKTTLKIRKNPASTESTTLKTSISKSNPPIAPPCFFAKNPPIQ